MSFKGNFGNIGGRSISSRSTNQFNPNPNFAHPIPSTPMLYHQPQIIRTLLPESEPMSEYSELQITSERLRPTPHHSMISCTSPRITDQIPQRVIFQNVRASPYSRSAMPSLMPPPTPHCYATNYSSDQTFIMRPMTATPITRSPVAKGNMTFTFSSTAVKDTTSSSVKNSSQAKKITLNNRSTNRFLIGSVGQIVRWHKKAKEMQLYTIYEVPAILDSISYKPSGVYNLILRGEQKNDLLPLQAVFYPIDREIPQVKTGDLITCVGRMVGANKLQVYDLWPTAPDSLAGLKRISFLCQRTMQEALLVAPEP